MSRLKSSVSILLKGFAIYWIALFLLVGLFQDAVLDLISISAGISYYFGWGFGLFAIGVYAYEALFASRTKVATAVMMRQGGE